MSVPARTSPWYAEGLHFTCTRCGNCCTGAPGYVWVSEREIREIAEYTSTPIQLFRTHHTRQIDGRTSLLEVDNGDCEYLARDEDGKARCTIHPVRPLQCRTWPFWESNIRSARTWSLTARNCPGMNQGQHHPLPVIRAAVQEARRAGLDL